MADVFISYAPSDRKRGAALADALAAEGFTVARAADAGGAQERRAGLAASAAVIVCWSRAGAKADAVFAAAAQGYNQGKLIALLLQPVEPPHPYDLVETIDFSGWRGQGGDPAWAALLAAVEALARRRPPTGATPAAAAALAPAAAPARPKPANLFAQRPAPPADAAPPEADQAEPARNRAAMGAIVAMALAVAALWAGPHVIDALNKVAGGGARRPAAAVTRDDLPPAPIYPKSSAAPAPEASAAPGAADQSGSAPPASSPVPELNTPVVTPVGETAKKDSLAPLAADKANADGDPGQVMAGLETCLHALARECPHADPALAAGFSADRRVSAAERRLLGAPLFPDRGLVTADNLKVCLATLKAKTQSALDRACPALAPKAEPAPKEAAPKPEAGAKPAEEPALPGATARAAPPP